MSAQAGGHPTPTRRNILKLRGYRMIWIGSTASTLGDRIYEIALMWYVLQRTGSALQTGTVPAFSLVGQVTLGLIGGAVADKLSRRKIMIGGDFLRAGIVGATALLASLGILPIWYVYLSAFLLSAIGMFYDPATIAVLPDLVGEENVLQANAYLSGASRFIQIVGRGIGGGAVTVFGEVWAIAGNSMSFAISAACLLLVPFPAQPKHLDNSLSASSILKDTRAGVGYLLKAPVLRALALVAVAANFGGGLTTGIVPVLADRQLGGDATLYGLLLTALSLGEFAGMLLMGAVGPRIPLGRSLAISLISGGAVYVAIASTRLEYLAIALFAIEGLALAVGNLPIRTLLQTSTPSSLRGRVFSGFVAAINLGSPAATALGAALASVVSIAVVYAVAGVLVIAAGAWSLRSFGDVRQ